MTVLDLASPLGPVIEAALDPAEEAVIQLPLERSIEWVSIDDKKARRMALAIGLNVVGTLGLLLRAKNLNLLPSIGPYLSKLREAGSWYHEDLVRRVLDDAGE